jgi:hypothetical protein
VRRFGPEQYLETSVLIAPLLADVTLRGFALGKESLPDAENAVYIALDNSGSVAYVGSVARRTKSALRSRIEEHLRYRQESSGWREVWVLLLLGTASQAEVRWAEARVGRFLGPSGNRRLPRFPSTRS